MANGITMVFNDFKGDFFMGCILMVFTLFMQVLCQKQVLFHPHFKRGGEGIIFSLVELRNIQKPRVV